MVVRMYTGPHARRTSPLVRAVPYTALLCALITIGAQVSWVWALDRYMLTNIVVLSCAAASTLTLAVRLRWRRGLLSAMAVLLVSWGIEMAGVHTGYPFGRYTYISPVGADPVAGVPGHTVPMLAGVPLLVPAAWLMMLVPVYFTCQSIHNGVLARLGWAIVGLVGWDFFLDPQFVSEGWWHWADAHRYIRGLPGIPVSNYIGWIVAATVLVALMWVLANAGGDAGPLMRTPLATGVPVLVYMWTWAGGVFANLVFFNRPASALWGGVIMGWPAAMLLISSIAKRGRGRGGSPLRDSRVWA